MEISPDLLKRYLDGLCTQDEIKRVEQWLELEKNEPSDLSERQAQQMKVAFWENIRPIIQENSSTLTIPLYRKVVRYAAAVFIIFASFLGGRFSAGSAQANPIVDNSLKDHLYIFGWNEAQAHLPGDSFQIKFDGTIKLYNSGFAPKTIQVGDTSMILESYKNYYLTGNSVNPKLRIHTATPKFGKGQAATFSGDFSIHRLDK